MGIGTRFCEVMVGQSDVVDASGRPQTRPTYGYGLDMGCERTQTFELRMGGSGWVLFLSELSAHTYRGKQGSG